MTDFERIEMAFDILEDAEVMQEFDDEVWIKVDKEMWNEFNGNTEEDKQAELAIAMIEEGRLIDTDGSLVRIEVSRELYEEFHNNVSGIGDDDA